MSYVSTARERLYVNVMGREFRFVAVFDTDEEANAFMRDNTDTAVCAVVDNRVYIGSLRHSENQTH